MAEDVYRITHAGGRIVARASAMAGSREEGKTTLN